MSYDIEIVEGQPIRALVIESRCAPPQLAQVLGASFGQVVQYIMASGAAPEGMPFMRYLDMSETEMHIQAGMPSCVPGTGEIQSIELPGGQLATTLYLGPYAGVGVAWDVMGEWAAVRGGTIRGGWDVYENDPDSVADESELRTRLYLPVS